MKKMKILIAALCMVLSISFAWAESVNHQNSDLIVIKAKHGDTVSLLCIEMYGYYNRGLGKTFLKDNPSVQNINVIFSGQKLFFRKQAGRMIQNFSKEDNRIMPEGTEGDLFAKDLHASHGVVTWLEGSVWYTENGTLVPEKLEVNAIVYPGDTIETKSDGLVEIVIERESVLRMDHNTVLTIKELRKPLGETGKTRITFFLGKVWTMVKRFKDKVSRFELELPTSIAGVHGTVYQTSVSEDNQTEVKVFEGSVHVKKRSIPIPQYQAGPPVAVAGPTEIAGPKEVSLGEWIRVVESMQRIVIDKKGVASDAEPFTLNTKSAWERWNKERDQRLDKIFNKN